MQKNIYLTPERKQLLDRAMQRTGKTNASEVIELALKQLLVNLPEREAPND